MDQWKDVQPRGRGSSSLKPVGREKVLDSQEREHFLETAERVAPEAFPFILFLAETGCRIGEATALRWTEVDLDFGVARLYREKTGGQATDVELSARLREVLGRRRSARLRASLRHGRLNADSLEGFVFPNGRGGLLNHQNFRRRVFNAIVKEAFPDGRALTPHCLRHTWASLHLSRGSPLKKYPGCG